jgi:hypothetical protein
MIQRKSPARKGEAGVLLAVEPGPLTELEARAQDLSRRFGTTLNYARLVLGLLRGGRDDG